MIKKWDSFIKESVDFSNLKEEIKLAKDNRHLDSIFDNDLKSNDHWGNLVRTLYNYCNYRNNELSKEIHDYLQGQLKESSLWSEGRNEFRSKTIDEKKSLMLKVIDYYDKIKEELGPDGYPLQSKLNKDIESICDMSLVDDDILEFHEVEEDVHNLIVVLGCDENIKIDHFVKIADDLSSLCSRLEDAIGIKNKFIKFTEENTIRVGFHFQN